MILKWSSIRKIIFRTILSKKHHAGPANIRIKFFMDLIIIVDEPQAMLPKVCDTQRKKYLKKYI